MPLAASMKPEAARSTLFTFKVTSRGVLDESCGLIGPAFPERLAFPPPGKVAFSLRGNWDVYEKFVTSTFTLSYTWFFFAEFALPTINFPSLISSLATEKFWAAEAPDFSGSGVFFSPAVPRLEKFHTPFGAFSNVIWGSFSAIRVTFNCLEKISGISATPTLSDFAVMKGDLLKAESSAMLMSSITTLPDRMERLRSPNFT